MRLTLHFDGSCWPNPGGLAKFGWTLNHPNLGGTNFKGNGFAGDGPLMSNNFAELFAMAEGLEYASHIARPGDVIEVLGDSEIAVYLMSGKYKANKDKLYWPAYDRCKRGEQWFFGHDIHVEYKWIPREKNQECDDLSKLPASKPVSQTLLDEAEDLLI